MTRTIPKMKRADTATRNITVRVYEGLEPLAEYASIRRVDVELSDGQRFTLKAGEHHLYISADDGSLTIQARATNAVWIKAEDW